MSDKENPVELSPLNFFDIDECINKDRLNNIIDDSDINIKKLFQNINKIIKIFRKKDYFSEIIPIPLSRNNIYWTDYINYYLHTLDPEWDSCKYINFVVYIDATKKINTVNRNISVTFTPLDIYEKQFICKTFQKYLPYHFEWDGKNTNSMTIKYLSKKYFKIPRLKFNDFYPTFYCNIKLINKTQNPIDPYDCEYMNSLMVLFDKVCDTVDGTYNTYYFNLIGYCIDESNETKVQIKNELNTIVKQGFIASYSAYVITDLGTYLWKLSDDKNL